MKRKKVEIARSHRNREGQNGRVTEDVIIAGCRHCLAFSFYFYTYRGIFYSIFYIYSIQS